MFGGFFCHVCFAVASFCRVAALETGFDGSADAGSSFLRLMDGMKGHRVYCNVEYITTLTTISALPSL